MSRKRKPPAEPKTPAPLRCPKDRSTKKPGCGSVRLVVEVRRGRVNYFRGHRRRQWSPLYSALRCLNCGRVWRTKSPKVSLLPDATPSQESIAL